MCVCSKETRIAIKGMHGCSIFTCKRRSKDGWNFATELAQLRGIISAKRNLLNHIVCLTVESYIEFNFIII